MGEWKRVKLGEVAQLLTGFPFDGHKYSTEGMRVLRGENVSIGKLRWDTDKRWNELFDRESEYSLHADDIVVGMDGSRVGRNRAMINSTDLPMLIAQRVACVRAKDVACQKFLYYTIFSNAFLEYIESIKTGSAIPHVSLSQLADYAIPFPDLPTQRRIAAVLGALDDKIEVNRKICENLEAQAQALFKAWFVDFEPFGGKRPEGWKMGKLGDVAEYYDGKIEAAKLTPASYFSTENMLANREGAVDAETVPQSGVVPLCDEGCVLVSNIRPYFKKIIRVNCVGGHSPDVLCFKAKALERQWYLYRMLWDDAFFAYVMSSTKGTKMPRGDKGHIMDYPCVLPFANDIRKFNDTLASLSGRIEVANRESRALAAMRDALLPKLMSGELAVEKVEGV